MEGVTMLYVTKRSISKVARKITCDSWLWGDEIETVELQLGELVYSAETYGCKITGEVPNMWGGTVTVCAVPSHYRHSWTF